MHTHSNYSDSYTPISKIIKKAVKRGFGISITDHNEIGGVLEAFKLKKENKLSILIIPGIELNTIEGPHILAYFDSAEKLKAFYIDNVKPFKRKKGYGRLNKSIISLIRSAKRYGGMVSLAHPYSYAYANIPKQIKKGNIPKEVLIMADAIETINGVITKGRNNKAIKLATTLGKAFTGGSDAHTLFEVGNVLTYANAFNAKEFLNEVANKRNMVIGKPKNQIIRMGSILKSFNAHLTYKIHIKSINQKKHAIGCEV